MSSRVKQLKKQLAVAAISVVMACVALGSATYAWFAFNNTVSARTATVTAMANGMTLQIVAGTTPDHGKDNDTVAFDSTTAHEISPSSTDDAKTWFVPRLGAMVLWSRRTKPSMPLTLRRVNMWWAAKRITHIT